MSQNYEDEWVPATRSKNAQSLEFQNIVLLCILAILMWIAFKIVFRLIRMLVRPLLYIALVMLFWKTLQFSNNPTIIDFVLNLISNACELFVQTVDIALRIFTNILQ